MKNEGTFQKMKIEGERVRKKKRGCFLKIKNYVEPHIATGSAHTKHAQKINIFELDFSLIKARINNNIAKSIIIAITSTKNNDNDNDN